jgi:hypothetical protein
MWKVVKIVGEACTNYVMYRYNITEEVVVEEKDKKRDKNIEGKKKKNTKGRVVLVAVVSCTFKYAEAR